MEINWDSINYFFQIPRDWFRYIHRKIHNAYGTLFIRVVDGEYGGMKIDIERRSFALANKTGGMSGPAIKPIAVRMVYQCAKAVNIPIIGMGGIASSEDAIEFLMAGATAVAAGAMNFVNPYLTEELVDGIDRFLDNHNVSSVKDIIGCVE